jgi:hypothetical protein
MAEKLSGMSLADQQEYVDNMAEVVDAAKKSGLSDTDAIGTYIQMKDTQIEIATAQHAERTQMRIYVAEATGSTFGLIGLFSLILVLLAIERNTRTRRTEAAGQ